MSNYREDAPWWRWLLLPGVVIASWGLAVALGSGAYLLLFDLLCPSEARFDSSCYSDAMLLTEKLMILSIAGLSGIVLIWSGYLTTPRAPFLTGQWLALISTVLATLALLMLDWGMWPLYGAFLTGLALALVGVKYRLRSSKRVQGSMDDEKND